MEENTTTQSPKKSRFSRKLKKHFNNLVVGLIIGIIATTAIRFSLAKDNAVHYHANFALYINGKQDQFKSFTFYEEIAACDAHSDTNPKVRTHMHDNNNHLIHVHDGAVTWGNFFENLGYTLGDDLIKTDDGVYITGDDGNKLSFTLNGESVDVVANKVINSEDVLLVNYGKDDKSTLQDRYNAIPRDAKQANVTKDPSACAGAHEFTFWNRLKQAIGVQESH